MEQAEKIMPTHIIAGAGVVLNEGGEVLLVRTPRSGWVFPGGQVEVGENVIDAVRREILEETGLTADIDTGFRRTVTFYPKPGVVKDVVFFTARKIFSYPVHRQRWPDISLRISSSENSRLASRISAALIINPGLQKPHCTAASSIKACWISEISPLGPARPSRVRISFPSAHTAK